MQTNQPPGEQTPEPVVAPADQTEIRPTENVTLEEAAPIEPPAAEPRQRQRSRRDEQMDAIVVARRAAIDAELAESVRQGLQAPPQLDAEPAPTPTEPQEPLPGSPAAPAAPSPSAAPLQPGVEPAAPAAPTVRTHRILVNGRQIEMPEQDLYRAAERGVYAEARVQHANATLEEARRLAAASGQTIPGEGRPLPAPAAPTATPAPSGLDSDAARELARELLYGDEEKVAEAVQRLVQARQPAQAAPIDPRQIEEAVWNRLNGTRTLETALETFGREYQDIVADVDLTTLTAQYVQGYRNHYAQTGTQRSELELFREAGDAVRDRLNGWRGVAPAQPNGGQPTPATTPQPAVAPGARIAIKRATPQAPAAASAPQEPATPPLRSGMTPSETVAWMKRTRGQPVSA